MRPTSRARSARCGCRRRFALPRRRPPFRAQSSPSNAGQIGMTRLARQLHRLVPNSMRELDRGANVGDAKPLPGEYALVDASVQIAEPVAELDGFAVDGQLAMRRSLSWDGC